ncbi:CNNM domain-containing protein [Halalkalicoccus subterraneus]|uniref:CNNM domain-containing protein n=1 Tax=Halalkalicoccus subterraneus TaxID=2675002 RepID=UPI000EFD7977|nr:hemolysin family protein [Halalkalicoccus subterraneus]
MVTLEIAARLLAGALLIVANAFFVATEFGLTRARQFTEEEFVGGDPALQRAWDMTDDLELYLTTCQIWISGTSIALGIIAEPGLAALLEPIFANTTLASVGAASLLAFFIINMIHLTHGEQTPTYLGVERSRQVCRYGARPLYWFARSIAPLIRFGDWVAKGTLGLFGVEMTGAWLETEQDVIESRADLRHRMERLLAEGNLDDERYEEVLGALAVGRMTVSDIMVDREEIVFLSTDLPLSENLERLSGSLHNRYPLIGEDPDDFRGIVYVSAVLDEIDALQAGEKTIEDIAAPPLTVSEETTVSDVIDRFQEEHQELALVRSEEDDLVGLVTATDAMEAVVGELEDPLDEAADDSTA